MTAGDTHTSACGDRAANCPSANGLDFDFGSSAPLVKTADHRELVIAGQKSGRVYALDPARDRALVWQARVGTGGVNDGIQWGMASDDRHVYAAVSDVLRVGKIGSDPQDIALHAEPDGGRRVDGPGSQGRRQAWRASPPPCGSTPGCSPAQSAALTAMPGIVFSGSLDGHLRAHAADVGSILWDVDTVRDDKAVNGVTGHGGSLDGPGPVVVGGTVFVNSDYARFGGIPGNVRLALAPR